ncbi:hypothetical protein AB1Y20_013398 [Prymnesium parvum]|uniref:N-acetyltransferase domain-containing protein n=1 Tax=Prymnesium parvum TaxID=97485 RepID=A0AB34IFH9_PRYPA
MRTLSSPPTHPFASFVLPFPRCAPPHSLLIRLAHDDELASIAATLCAPHLLPPPLSPPLRRLAVDDILHRFAGPERRRLDAIGASALFVAADGPQLVGACGVQLLALTSAAACERRITRDDKADMAVRPLASNLVVAPPYRRKGIGARLVARVERCAADWGFDEMLLKVEADNLRARRFYASLGYHAVARDTRAERPARTLFSRVRWERTTLVCMRKLGLRRAGREALAESLEAEA